VPNRAGVLGDDGLHTAVHKRNGRAFGH
jgi:hypothetical protein